MSKAKLQCTKSLYMDPAAVEGSSYKIVDEDEEEIRIVNEYKQRHTFSKDPKHEAYFGNWFRRDEK